MSFDDTFEKILGKYKRILTKIEHKHLKNIYLGKEKAIIIKKKGLRKDSPKRKLAEEFWNYYYLRNYGKMKKEALDIGKKYFMGGDI